MKIDAHYYAVLGFARACRFKKESAREIAYASQFVDDAKINHIVIDGDPGDVNYDLIEDRPSFFNMATCHSYTRVKTFNYSAMMNNTSAFHFVPGCEGPNFPKRLRCREESPVVMGILTEVLNQDNLVRFGMVLHAYADTFSHQGFSGLLSKANDIRDCRTLSKLPWNWSDIISKVVKRFTKDKFDKFLDKGMPAYGHGQALEYPDLPYLSWTYKYDFSDEFSEQLKDSGEIDNRDRFVRAFKKIKGHLVDFLDRHPQHRDDAVTFTDFEKLYETLITCKPTKQRIRNWQTTLVNLGLFENEDDAVEYDEHAWLIDAFSNFDEKRFASRKVDHVQLAATFPDSSWYQYYRGVKWYKERFYHYCSQCDLLIPC